MVCYMLGYWQNFLRGLLGGPDTSCVPGLPGQRHHL